MAPRNSIYTNGKYYVRFVTYSTVATTGEIRFASYRIETLV